MKTLGLTVGLCLCVCLGFGADMSGAEKQAKEGKGKTCCETAIAKGKECDHKCCVAAHKTGGSCVKCNPAKQDLAARKAASKK